MPPKRRQFERPLGDRRYRKLFVIAVEGTKTEPHYFAIFNDQNSVIRVNCLKGGLVKRSPAPRQVAKTWQALARECSQERFPPSPGTDRGSK
ncbi:MAG: hypothetical protein ACOYKZ_06495, partial [Chlamydiia bacterium]